MKKVIFQISMVFLLFACSSSPPESSTPEGGPFAVLRFKVSGCMSCSHCRSVIRQVERGVGEGRLLSVGDEEAVLQILNAGPIDIHAEVSRLLASGIIRFQIHEVELYARGTFDDGRFVMEDSGQVFRVEGPAPEGSGSKDVRATVEHWDNLEKMTLKLP